MAMALRGAAQVSACLGAAQQQQDPGKPRRRRSLTKRDPMMEIEKREVLFWETSYREFVENNQRCLLHAEFLKSKGNMYAVTLDIAKKAEEFQRNNKAEACVKHPILKAIGEEMNKELGMKVTDAYMEDVVDYSQYMNSPYDDPEEEIEISGPPMYNASNWCERTEWKGKDSGDPGWRRKIKRKDIVWIRLHDRTRDYRMF